MKKHFSVTLLLIAFGGLVSLYFGCASQPTSNGNANTVALASPEPTPDKAAIEAELTRLENDWPRILKEHDADAVKRLEAEDILLVYPDGSSGSKEVDVKDIESAALSADSWEISELTVSVLDNDCAVVRMRTTVKGGKYKLPNGQSRNISGQYRSVDTFRRRNGQWQLVASATVPVLNPEQAANASPAPKSTPATKPSPAAKTSPATKPSPRVMASPARTKTP
jgi:ketosteroid isomerase-like protein